MCSTKSLFIVLCATSILCLVQSCTRAVTFSTRSTNSTQQLLYNVQLRNAQLLASLTESCTKEKEKEMKKEREKDRGQEREREQL